MPVFKRGRYWYVRFQSGGVEYKRSTGCTKKADAQGFERRWRTAIESGATKPRTYGDALDRYRPPESMRSPTRNTWELAPYPLTEVVAAAHEMRDRMLDEGYSPQTINRRLAVVRRILNIAYREWDWLAQPLGQKIKLLSEKGLERQIYLTPAEVEGLARGMPEPAATITLLAAYTGLRRGALLQLQPEHWHPPYLILPAGMMKGRRSHAAAVPEPLIDRVQLPWGITDHELRKAWEASRAASGMEGVRFHDLRHTFASWLAKDPEIPLTLIRDALGHSSLTVTSKYSHLRRDDLAQVAGKLSAQLDRQRD
jgi:integrase